MSPAPSDVAAWWRPVAGGIHVSVRVVPGARRSEVVGPIDGALRVKLAARPVDGRANEELVRFLAARFGVRRSTVGLARGERSRSKVVLVEGIDGPPADLLSSSAEAP